MGLLGRRASSVTNALLEGAGLNSGGNEVASEGGGVGIRDVSVDLIDLARSINVVEELGGLDGVSASSSGVEVVSSGEVVSHIDGLAGSEDSEGLGVVALCSGVEAVLDL